MNPWMLEGLARDRADALHDDARRAALASHGPRPRRGQARLGWLLIETGLRLVTNRRAGASGAAGMALTPGRGLGR